MQEYKISRRKFLELGVGAALGASLLTTGCGGGSSTTGSSALTIGYFPITAGLPLYLGIEKGYFEEAGLNVEATKFTSTSQIVEALIAGRMQGTANGTGSGNLALGEATSPGLFKIIASNPSNAKLVLDEIVVAKDSPIKKISDLRGKRVASGPAIQNKTIAETILEENGVTDVEVKELPIDQHLSTIKSGQIDAAYTLEPTGTIGRLQGLTRVLEAGVVAKYILGDPLAPWFGGSATVTTTFLEDRPDDARKYIDAYRRAVDDVRKDPEGSRRYLAGYTALEGDAQNEVPLPGYTFYDEFGSGDIEQFQKFFDFFRDKGILSSPVEVEPLIFKDEQTARSSGGVDA